MHPRRAPCTYAATDELECALGVVNVGGDADPTVYPSFGGPEQNRLPIVTKGIVREMAMTVEELDAGPPSNTAYTASSTVYTVAGWGFFLSALFPSPHFFWISMSAGDATKIDE
jgi:hypothetical protein